GLQAWRDKTEAEEIGTVEEAAFGQWRQGVALGIYVDLRCYGKGIWWFSGLGVWWFGCLGV
ncbi:MAG: hypothetical protein K5928_01515, partial [Prevotella sp.]|nr:hypothetical protein [Prevotella sp.]